MMQTLVGIFRTREDMQGALGELAKFKERAAQRPIAAQEVPPALLARYEAIRKKYDGIGMARISKTGSCEACGTRLPTKVVEDVKDGRVVTCEACHRILYASEGLL